MTAEIAIMNAQAVALAADSAVTFGQKIKNTANKIFALSKFEPVGLMIYNGANLLDLPWETVVKVYRRELGRQTYDTLEEYAKAFLEFIQSDTTIRSAIHQDRRAASVVSDAYLEIRDAVFKRIEAHIADAGSITPATITILLDEEIAKYNADLLVLQLDTRIQRNGGSIDVTAQAIASVFGTMPISDDAKRILEAIASFVLDKIPITDYSGLVVAGFGAQQLYPSLVSYRLHTFADESLVILDDRRYSISPNNAAYVAPFAQSEVVATFMDGVDPYYQNVIDAIILTILRDYPSKVLAEVTALSDDQKNQVIDQFRPSAEKIAAEYLHQLRDLRREKFSHPITAVVQSLPKDELAAMAEALVNLTSFKRKVSMDPETVGGPIDVAVISKGDGFIWIKRKHYFEPKLNPQFFDLYYWRERHGGTSRSRDEE